MKDLPWDCSETLLRPEMSEAGVCCGGEASRLREEGVARTGAPCLDGCPVGGTDSLCCGDSEDGHGGVCRSSRGRRSLLVEGRLEWGLLVWHFDTN